MKEVLPPLPELKRGSYRHYKGGEYEVMLVVRHSETLEPMVVYRAISGEPGLWTRPFNMFTDNVVLSDGQEVPRFKKV